MPASGPIPPRDGRPPGALRGREWALAVAIGLLALSIRAPLLGLPLDRDEGEYAYIAWRLGHGELPYRDWFDQKPPGIFLAYRLALALPLEPPVAIRGLAALASSAAAVALFLLARRLLGAPAAALAALLLAWTSADPLLQGPIANTELFMLPWLILANLAFVDAARADAPRALSSLLAGALLGVAASFKQVAAVDALLFALLFPLLARGRAGRVARFLGWAALGGVAVWLPILGWFLAKGGLGALLDAVLLHNLAYAGGLSGADRLRNLLANGGALWDSAGVACVLAGVGLVALSRSRERWRALYLAGWLVAGAAGASASGYYFAHYFQQLLPPLAVAAAAGAQALHRAPGWWRVPSAVRAAILAAIALAAPVLHSASLWRVDAARAMSRIHPGNPFEVMPGIAAEIAAQSEPDDAVFVYGSEAEIYFTARRRSASRYIFLFPLFGPYADALARQRDVIEEIRAARPAVIATIPNPLFFRPDAEHELTRWLEGELAASYRLHAIVVALGGSRGRLLRAGDPGFDAAAIDGAWARLFVRR